MAPLMCGKEMEQLSDGRGSAIVFMERYAATLSAVCNTLWMCGKCNLVCCGQNVRTHYGYILSFNKVEVVTKNCSFQFAYNIVIPGMMLLCK